MKGRKLSLEEVLNLEDGSKVWVEELDEAYRSSSDLYEKTKERLYILNTDMYYDLKCDFVTPIEFYEWIDEQSKVYKMSVEICNLRGLDLTDENIEIIIKEFSWQTILDGV